MTIKEVADLLFDARGRIDFHWNFYVVVVIATIGWLLTLKKALTRPMKLLVSVAYAVAAVMNLMALHGAYTLAEALRTDLLRMAAGTPLTDTRLILEQHSYLTQRGVAVWVHLIIGATILGVIWFARLTEPDEAVAKAATDEVPAGRSRRGRKGA